MKDYYDFDIGIPGRSQLTRSLDFKYCEQVN